MATKPNGLCFYVNETNPDWNPQLPRKKVPANTERRDEREAPRQEQAAQGA